MHLSATDVMRPDSPCRWPGAVGPSVDALGLRVDPAVARVTSVAAHLDVPPSHLRERVVGKALVLEATQQLAGDRGLEVVRHGKILAALGAFVVVIVRRALLHAPRRQSIQPRRVEAEDLALR